MAEWEFIDNSDDFPNASPETISGQVTSRPALRLGWRWVWLVGGLVLFYKQLYLPDHPLAAYE